MVVGTHFNQDEAIQEPLTYKAVLACLSNGGLKGSK